MRTIRVAVLSAFLGCLAVVGSIAPAGADADYQIYVQNDTNYYAWITVYRPNHNYNAGPFTIDYAYCVLPHTTGHSGHHDLIVKKVRAELRRDAGCHGKLFFDRESFGHATEQHYIMKGIPGAFHFYLTSG